MGKRQVSDNREEVKGGKMGQGELAGNGERVKGREGEVREKRVSESMHNGKGKD